MNTTHIFLIAMLIRFSPPDLICANILLNMAIIANEAFTALLLMALGSTMLTMPQVKSRLARLASG